MSTAEELHIRNSLWSHFSSPFSLEIVFDSAANGFSCSLFHKICAEVGDTICVGRFDNGTLFGGYSSKTWNIQNEWVVDDKSFLFRLSLGKEEGVKIAKASPSAGIFTKSNYGPTFGSRQCIDLCLFSNDNWDGTNAQHNPSANFRYDVSDNSLTGGFASNWQEHSEAFAVRVYKINWHTGYKVDDPLPELWVSHNSPHHKIQWNIAYREELLVSLEKLSGLYEQPSNILLFGAVGAGKSSLIMSLESILEGRIVQSLAIATGQGTITTQLGIYPLEHNEHTIANLWDSAGWEDGIYDDGELDFILQGSIAPNTDLKQSLTSQTPGFNQRPELHERMHCVLLCVAATDISNEDVMTRQRRLHRFMLKCHIPCMLVVTKVDLYDPALLNSGFEDSEGNMLDMRNIYRSGVIKELIQRAAEISGIPELYIFPVKNFAGQEGLSLATDIQLLRLLEQSVLFAKDFRKKMFRRAASCRPDYLQDKAESVPPSTTGSLTPSLAYQPLLNRQPQSLPLSHIILHLREEVGLGAGEGYVGTNQ
mmetsp:Transcript_23087/g.75269  ORF Transcript_23087/g.75269 Transcript_23087/m.75269 type:complete len:536 (-) Transcript_23087:211-1818(-)